MIASAQLGDIRPMPTEKQILKAIRAMDAARSALAPLLHDDPNDSVLRLRTDLAEYAGYLEGATWWRKS